MSIETTSNSRYSQKNEGLCESANELRQAMATQFAAVSIKEQCWDIDKDPYGYKKFRRMFQWGEVKPKQRGMVLPWGVAFASSIIIAFCVWHLFAPKLVVDDPFVFVEIKALDSFGRPVSGAEVKFNDKSMGLTDTFGEWRRLLRLTLGSSIPLEIVKKISHEEIRATKIIRLPAKVGDQRNLELRVNVRLNTAPAGNPAAQNNARSTDQKPTGAIAR